MATVSSNANSHTNEQRIRELKQQRRAFKGQITKFRKYLGRVENTPKNRYKLRYRIHRMRNQFETFNKIQDELAVIDNYDEVEAERDTTTDQFDDVIAEADVLFDTLKKDAAPSTPASLTTDASTKSPASPTLCSIPVNLPKIDLPKFDGRIETWVTFKDAFQTLIHTQPGLSKIQKLNYLRLSLNGRAADAIDTFSITEDNYDVAWTHLNEIYNNKRVLILRHTALFRDTPAMNDDSSESIRDLVNHMQSHVRSLQAFGRNLSDDDIGNDFLCSVVISKMGWVTRKAWERTLKNTDAPKIGDIFTFLHLASHQSKDYASTYTPRTRQNYTNATVTKPRPMTRSQHSRPHTPHATQSQRRQTYAMTVSANPERRTPTSTPRSSPPVTPRSSPPSTPLPPSPRLRRRQG
nr:uncharacterized protein LOC116431249 [Nomia melanderi]